MGSHFSGTIVACGVCGATWRNRVNVCGCYRAPRLVPDPVPYPRESIADLYQVPTISVTVGAWCAS